MATCPHCAEKARRSFRFCPGCGAPLRLKVTELFAADPERSGDAARALRVSRYQDAIAGTGHVRFSVWAADGTATAAVSLATGEARRLASFLSDPAVSSAGPAVPDEEPAVSDDDAYGDSRSSA